MDLGSGVGKAVLGAAVVHPFSRCVGIEILESLHREALLAARRWEEHAASRPTRASLPLSRSRCATAPLSPPGVPAPRSGRGRRRAASTTVVDFRLGDFTTLEVYNWPKADVVFVNSTCFSAAVLDRIVRLASACGAPVREGWQSDLTPRLPCDPHIARARPWPRPPGLRRHAAGHMAHQLHARAGIRRVGAAGLDPAHHELGPGHGAHHAPPSDVNMRLEAAVCCSSASAGRALSDWSSCSFELRHSPIARQNRGGSD